MWNSMENGYKGLEKDQCWMNYSAVQTRFDNKRIDPLSEKQFYAKMVETHGFPSLCGKMQYLKKNKPSNTIEN